MYKIGLRRLTIDVFRIGAKGLFFMNIFSLTLFFHAHIGYQISIGTTDGHHT